MFPPSTARVVSIQCLAVAAAAGLPALLRAALHALVAGPILSAHVLLAQVAFLVVATRGARVLARTLRRPLPPWRRWAVDATGIAGAVALLVGARFAAVPHLGPAISLDRLTLLVGAPIVEEIVYRGMLPALLTPPGSGALGLTARLGVAMVSSAAFAAAHAGGHGDAGADALPALALSFGCGLAFHLLREASGGLAAPMAAHAGVNATTMGALG
jgi:membrane protease YdiL (CAAX protease family)